MSAQDDLAWISAWLNSSYRGNGVEIEEVINWRRFAKIGEEFGEATEAFYGMIGENPRKGVTHTKKDVIEELLDVAVAALGAVEHFSEGGHTLEYLEQKIEEVAKRGKAIEYGRVPSKDGNSTVGLGRSTGYSTTGGGPQ